LSFVLQTSIRKITDALSTLARLLLSAMYNNIEKKVMEMTQRKYAPLWNKYRPAILKMMLEAASEPQQYRMTEYEFRAMDSAKKKVSLRFNFVIADSRAVNNIRDSEAAQDLLHMLLMSRRGSELIQLNTYEMSLDKHFVLHIQQSNS
jgi:hypothetical protein